MSKDQPKKKLKPKKVTFEDKYDHVIQKIESRKKSWFLSSSPWIDWEDVKQIISNHVYTKWGLWDQSRSLDPWLNRIISNQIKNLLRNTYGNFLRPCGRCPFNSGGSIDNINESNNTCSWTKSGKQDTSCPLFKKWNKTKKHSFHINTASSIDTEDFQQKCNNSFDIDIASKKLHKLMKQTLNEKQYTIYEMLYIKNLDINKAAEKLGYKTSERGRSAGYKQIKNFEKTFKNLAKKLINRNDII